MKAPVVAASGEFDERAGEALRAAVDRALGRESEIVVDLRKVTTMTLLGRAALRELQAALQTMRARVAYLTGSPSIRGAVLLAIHGHPQARACLTPKQAEDWLSCGGSSSDYDLRRVAR